MTFLVSLLHDLSFIGLPFVALASLCILCILIPQHWKQQHHQLLMQSIKPGAWITTVKGISGKVLDLQQASVYISCADGTLKQIAKDSVIHVDHEKT